MSSAARPRMTARISDSLHRQQDVYALVASAAGVSVLALAGASEAKVVYTETNQVTRARVPLYIDLNHDGIDDFLLRTTYYAGTSYFKVGLSAAGCDFNNAIAGQRSSRSSYFFSAASALPVGARIGPKNKFPVHHSRCARRSNGNRFIGFHDCPCSSHTKTPTGRSVRKLCCLMTRQNPPTQKSGQFSEICKPG